MPRAPANATLYSRAQWYTIATIGSQTLFNILYTVPFKYLNQTNPLFFVQSTLYVIEVIFGISVFFSLQLFDD